MPIWRSICVWSYTLAELECRRKKPYIISFDVKNEEFKETHLPDFGCPRKHLRQFKLINLKGFLALITFPSATHIEMWMLKDYQKKERVTEDKISSKVWERGPDNNGPRRANTLFGESYNNFVIGAGCQGLVLADSFGHCILVDLQNKCIWDMKLPKGYNKSDRRTFCFTVQHSFS